MWLFKKKSPFEEALKKYGLTRRTLVVDENDKPIKIIYKDIKSGLEIHSFGRVPHK